MTNISVFNKINDVLLNSKKPSYDIIKMIKEGQLKNTPFEVIEKLQYIDQNEKYHPEGNVLNHVLLVIDEANKVKHLSSDEKVFMWAAFMHDIGKLTTTKLIKNRISSYNHDVEGEKITFKILSDVCDDVSFNIKVSKLVRYHMQPLFYDKKKNLFEPEMIRKEVDYKEVALLAKSDRLGRKGFSYEYMDNEINRINQFIMYFEKGGNK